VSTVIKASSYEDFARLRAELPAIGASELAALLGVSPWDTAFSLWANKVHGWRKRVNAAMRWGRWFEDVIARVWSDMKGIRLEGDGLEIHVSDTHPFVSATPDRRTPSGELVEVKLASFGDGWGEEGTDEVPEHYKAQAQQQMFVLDRDRVDFAVLVGGTELREYRVKRDREFMDKALEIERQFWDEHVLAKVAPPMDYKHPSTYEAIKHLRKVDTSLILPLTPAEEEYLRQYARLKADERGLREELSALRNRILQVMGDAGRAQGLSFEAKQVPVHKDAYEVKAQDNVNLYVKERK
jgi:putative phage-type endonuclease